MSLTSLLDDGSFAVRSVPPVFWCTARDADGWTFLTASFGGYDGAARAEEFRAQYQVNGCTVEVRA